MCLRSSAMAKMDPSAANMALAVWNGYVQDATYSCDTCVLVEDTRRRPVEQSGSMARTWVS